VINDARLGPPDFAARLIGRILAPMRAIREDGVTPTYEAETDRAVATTAAALAVRADRRAFWLCVGLVMVFSQFWVMPLTGPGPGTIDPAVSASIRNYFFPCYLVVIWLASRRFSSVAMVFLRAPELTLLLVVALASTVWSLDPSVTERRWVAVVLTTLTGVVIADRFSWPKFLEVFASAYGIVVVLCFVFALAFPRYGRMIVEFPGAWRGVWGHKNLLGYHMSVAFTVFAACAVLVPRRRAVWVAAMTAALALMLLSLSKTSLASCLIGASCIPLVAIARRGPAWSVVATLLWVSAVIALVFMLYAAPDVLLGLVGKDQTLTGRTKIWAAVLRQIAQRPVTGYGYGAVWDSQSNWGPLPWISKEQGFVIHEAHNTWLGLWLELGYVGLAAWIVLFLAVWVRAIVALYTRQAAYFALPFLVVFSLHTFTESAALAQNDLVWMLFAATVTKLAARDPPAAARQRAPQSPFSQAVSR
jgi:exopolysaccharide production protein ExoQ